MSKRQMIAFYVQVRKVTVVAWLDESLHHKIAQARRMQKRRNVLTRPPGPLVRLRFGRKSASDACQVACR